MQMNEVLAMFALMGIVGIILVFAWMIHAEIKKADLKPELEKPKRDVYYLEDEL